MKKLAIAYLLMPLGAAFAHPGHGVGDGGYSLLHYLSEPMHGLGAVLGIAVVAFTATRFFNRD